MILSLSVPGGLISMCRWLILIFMTFSLVEFCPAAHYARQWKRSVKAPGIELSKAARSRSTVAWSIALFAICRTQALCWRLGVPSGYPTNSSSSSNQKPSGGHAKLNGVPSGPSASSFYRQPRYWSILMSHNGSGPF